MPLFITLSSPSPPPSQPLSSPLERRYPPDSSGSPVAPAPTLLAHDNLPKAETELTAEAIGLVGAVIAPGQPEELPGWLLPDLP